MVEVATRAPSPAQPSLASGVELDMGEIQEFMGRFLSDMSGTAIGAMCALGDRLGLFRSMAEVGPATSSDLAARSGLNERYVREWLLALASAGYLVVDKETERFSLPAAPAAALAFEESPFYMGDMSRLLPALTTMLDTISDGFRSGQGVSQDDYPIELYETMWRKNANRLSKFLVQQWIPLIDGLAEKLDSGARVCQIGCENGPALILLAQAFPRSQYFGFDSLGLHIARARMDATTAGVDDRVQFQQCDAAECLPQGLDLIISLDALHDAPDPIALLKNAFTSMNRDGVIVLLETVGADRAVENTGPAAAILYAISTLYSVPIGLEAGAGRLGMLGFSQNSVCEICRRIGFQTVQPLLSPSPFNTLFEIRP
jgi:SAM-dependent methyltransferase